MLMMNFLQKEEHGARREQNVPAWENQVWRGRAGQGPPGSPVCESLCCSEGLGAEVTMAWLGVFLMSQLKATGGGKS